MQNIHWLGSGLSSIPGIRRLASNNHNLTVWNRTLVKAQKSIDHVNSDNVSAKIFNIKDIKEKISNPLTLIVINFNLLFLREVKN